MTHPAALSAEAILSQCEIRFVRRSGPGGQHRNKVSTGVVLRHLPTGVVAEASERRSQAENRSVALVRLRIKLATDVRVPWHAERQCSELWRSRCHGGRINIGERHANFPAILAEALDALAGGNFCPSTAARRLGCTSSQLVRLLKKSPRAFQQVNERRAAQGLAALK